MTQEFTPLEIQLIRSCLATKTDDEISELLERSPQDVRAQIDQITGGGGADRNQRVVDVKTIIQKQQQEKINSRVNKETARLKRLQKSKERNELKGVYEEKERKQRNRAERMSVQQKKQKTAWEERKTYKTRVIDYSKLKSVRVNKGTIVYVPKEMSNEDAIKQYEFNREHLGQKEHLPTNINSYGHLKSKN